MVRLPPVAGAVDTNADAAGLKTTKLDAELRLLKWTALKAKEANPPPADSITLTPEDRSVWIAAQFAATFPNDSAAMAAKKSKSKLPPYPASVMESRLLGTIHVTPDDLRLLANARAKSCLDYFLTSPARGAQAQEKQLQRSDLPTAVQKTADEQSKGYQVRGYSSEVEDGKLEYEVETTLNGLSRDVSMAPDGSVLEIEHQVAQQSLPAPVSQGLQKAAGGGKITKVESLTKNGNLVAYEAQVQTAGKHSEIQVGPGGQPLAHQE